VPPKGSRCCRCALRCASSFLRADAGIVTTRNFLFFGSFRNTSWPTCEREPADHQAIGERDGWRPVP